jgi:hypothetical protein
MTKKIIIGGGLSGLIWKFYNPEYQIISPDIGGMFARTHLVWIHDTIETRQFLKDLGWSNIDELIKKSYIGYSHFGQIHDALTQDMNLVLIQKKMTDWYLPVDDSFVPKTLDLSLSTVGGSNYMNTLDVDLVEVVRRLNENANVMNGFISEIGSDIIMVKLPDGTVEPIEYDSLISTIPAPFFWKLWGTEKDFKCKPITNITTPVKPSFYDNRFEMIYYGSDQKFSRVSFLNNKYTLEFTGIISKEEFEKLYPDLPVEEYFVVKQGRIFEGEPNLPPTEKIKFLGRFSKWKYGITTEHVIKDVLDYKNNK